MKSRIVLGEIVLNEKRKFGSLKHYYPCSILDVDGTEAPAMFSKDQIVKAMARADKNPEDVPKIERSFWAQVFGV